MMRCRVCLPLLLFGLTQGRTSAVAQSDRSPLEIHLAAAKEAQAQTNCHLAAQEYRAAVLLLPRSGEVRTNEGVALYCDGQLSAAVNELRAALHLNPSLTTPHLFLGLAAYRLGELDAAHEELTRYLAEVPNDLTARLWLGYTFAGQGRHPEAQEQFTEVLARDPHNLNAGYALGQSALGIAHADYLKLQTLDPSGVTLLRLSAREFQAQGDSPRASAAEAEAERHSMSGRVNSTDEAAVRQIADEAAKEQDQALNAFQTIVSTAPDSYQAHEVLGDAALAAHHDDEAILQYETVLRLNPTLPGVHETLSESLIRKGRFADALHALDAERALSPVASARLLTRIGQAEHAMGKDQEAVASLQDAVRQTDIPAEAYLLLGQVLLAEGHADAAVPQLEHFLTLRPNHSGAYYSLSRAFRILGNRAGMEKALAEYQRTSQDAGARALMGSLTEGPSAQSFSEDPTAAKTDAATVSNP